LTLALALGPVHAQSEGSYNFTLVISGSAGDPFWTKIVAGAQEAVEVLGDTVDVQFAGNDLAKQTNMIESALAAGTDGLSIVINDNNAYDAVIRQARDAGVPVVAQTVDDAEGANGSARMAFIGQSFEPAGYAIGRRMVQQAGIKSGDLVLTPVEKPAELYAIQRHAGVQRALDEVGAKSEILDTGDTALSEVLNRITQYLVGHPETAAVISLGGMPTEMTPQAIADAGLDIPNGGFDITQVIVQNIIDGRTIATVDQQPFYQGFFAADPASLRQEVRDGAGGHQHRQRGDRQKQRRSRPRTLLDGPVSFGSPADPAPARFAGVRSLRSVVALGRTHRAGNIIAVFLVLQALCISAALMFPTEFRYLSPSNVQLMLKAIPLLGVLAIGAGLLMISGEYDLSIGSVFTFSATVMAALFTSGVSPWLAAGAALLTGILIGGVHGLIVTRTGIPSFIATLGTMLFWRGMTILYNGSGSTSFNTTGLFEAVFAGTLLGIPVSFLWLLMLAFFAWLLLDHHRLGGYFFAVGGNRAAAVAIGIRPDRIKLVAFMIAGGCAALSGIFSTARVNSVTPVQGAGLELQAIAACVIGGFALTGGKGTVSGAVIGAALIYTVQDVLLLLRAPGFYLEMFVGIVIVAAAILNQMAERGR
jgi:simple sugar transport system permease protein